MTFPLPDFTPADLPFRMVGEPYDRERDYGLDFPDDPQAEPTLEEIKGYAARYEDAGLLDLHQGLRDG